MHHVASAGFSAASLLFYRVPEVVSTGSSSEDWGGHRSPLNSWHGIVKWMHMVSDDTQTGCGVQTNDRLASRRQENNPPHINTPPPEPWTVESTDSCRRFQILIQPPAASAEFHIHQTRLCVSSLQQISSGELVSTAGSGLCSGPTGPEPDLV